MRYNYSDYICHSVPVLICDIRCEFIEDYRIDRDSVPQCKYMYEVRSDDDGCGIPVSVETSVFVNFIGTIICDEPLPLNDDGYIIFNDDNFQYL